MESRKEDGNMIYCIIVMSSVTYALKAQSILARDGIGSRLEKLTRNRTLKGCGYGLRIEKSKLSQAESALKTEGVKIVEVVEY